MWQKDLTNYYNLSNWHIYMTFLFVSRSATYKVFSWLVDCLAYTSVCVSPIKRYLQTWLLIAVGCLAFACWVYKVLPVFFLRTIIRFLRLFFMNFRQFFWDKANKKLLDLHNITLSVVTQMLLVTPKVNFSWILSW